MSQAANAQMVNTIEGRITDEHGQPVDNAYVELLDSLDSMVAATRSSSQGKYTFRGMNRGRYTVKVRPYGKNLLESAQQVDVFNSIARAEYVSLDFRLRENPRLRPQTPIRNETIFAQEVPEDALELFNSGSEKLKSNNEDGFKDLEAAVKIYPTYFYALRELGVQYVVQGKPESAYPHLLKAIDVYKRCGECYYSLALAFSAIKQNEAAVEAAKASVTLLPNSEFAQLLYGIVLRLDGKYEASKEALLKAKPMFKKPNAEVSWQLSLVYNRLNENQKAAEELEVYLEESPDLKKDDKKKVRELIDKMKTAKRDN